MVKGGKVAHIPVPSGVLNNINIDSLYQWDGGLQGGTLVEGMT